MFQDRDDAARQLADKLKGRRFVDPLVLGIPRGGVITGAALARELDADLDVVLSRKLRAPSQPELAIGALTEDGRVYLNDYGREMELMNAGYVVEERRIEMDDLRRRRERVRKIRKPAPVRGRSVLVVDDGIATGSTMIAALDTLRPQNPHELIVAAPVAPPDRIEVVEQHCDEVVCVLTPRVFWAIGQFYREFDPVEDETMLQILAEFALPQRTAAG